MTTLISAAYPEQSMTQLARHWPSLDPDVLAYGPSRWRKEFGAGSPRGFAMAETARGVLAHLGRGRSADRVTIVSKARVDRGAARLAQSAERVIGMWGTAARTFDRVHGRRVLVFVNAHPDLHNAVLGELGLPTSHREMVPPGVREAVCRELELADQVLVPSRLVQADLMERGVPAGRIICIPYAVDLGRFTWTDRLFDRPRLKVLFLGQISHRKGVRLLAEALRDAGPAFECTAVGPVVSPELMTRLGRITVRPTIPHDELSSLMSDADLLVLPSHEDTFGLVVLEAMATGLPVVVSDGSGASEVVTRVGGGRVVRRGDVQHLTEILQMLHRDRSHLHQFSGELRSWREKTPDWLDYTKLVHAAVTGPGAPLEGTT